MQTIHWGIKIDNFNPLWWATPGRLELQALPRWGSQVWRWQKAMSSLEYHLQRNLHHHHKRIFPPFPNTIWRATSFPPCMNLWKNCNEDAVILREDHNLREDQNQSCCDSGKNNKAWAMVSQSTPQKGQEVSTFIPRRLRAPHTRTISWQVFQTSSLHLSNAFECQRRFQAIGGRAATDEMRLNWTMPAA